MDAAIFQRFRDRAASIEMQSVLDSRAVPVYSLMAISIAAAFFLYRATGFAIDGFVAMLPSAWVGFMVVGGMLARRWSMPRLGTGMETLGLAYGQAFVLGIIVYPLAVISSPFADSALSLADRMLGFDDITVINVVRSHPSIIWPLILVYRSFNWQPVLLLALLYRQSDRAWRFVTALAIASLMTELLFPLAPAVGTLVHYGITRSSFPQMVGEPWSFAGPLHLLKEGGVRFLSPAVFGGLVSFPSYHAAAGVVFVWIGWRTPLRWFFLALNITMIVAAIPVGAHYLVDILAGIGVGGASIAIANQTFLYSKSKIIDAAPTE